MHVAVKNAPIVQAHVGIENRECERPQLARARAALASHDLGRHDDVDPAAPFHGEERTSRMVTPREQPRAAHAVEQLENCRLVPEGGIQALLGAGTRDLDRR